MTSEHGETVGDVGRVYPTWDRSGPSDPAEEPTSYLIYTAEYVATALSGLKMQPSSPLAQYTAWAGNW